jgi:hypothetical protein
MALFYGWIIVAAGFVISCLGFGTRMALGSVPAAYVHRNGMVGPMS